MEMIGRKMTESVFSMSLEDIKYMTRSDYSKKFKV